MKTTQLELAAIVVASLSANADFFNNTANDVYTASGSFSITNTIGGGDVAAIFATGRSGNFYLSSSVGPTGGDPGDYYWEIFTDSLSIDLPVPAPWEQRIVGNRLPNDLVQLIRIGEPYNLDAFGGFTAHITENWYLGSYFRWMETEVSVIPINFSFDGVNTITLQGVWDFESHLYLEEGVRPDASVPDSGSLFAVYGMAILALVGIGRYKVAGEQAKLVYGH